MEADCFTIGSTVSCTTCFHQNIEGEVLAFDHTTKMLILNFENLECKSNSGSIKLNDVYIVNLSFCSDVQVKKEVSPLQDIQLKSINLHRLNTRTRNSVEHKRRYVSALAAGVSPDGQKLFMAIAKTISDSEVTWSGPNIVVFNDVTITPPYKVDNVTGNPDSRQLTYVKKIVEKYTSDQSGGESSGSSAPPSSNSTVSAN